MKVLFDTSVLVAAHVPSHAEYSSARLWLERAKQGAFEFVVAAHTLMETYAVLTRLPLKPRIMPATAFQFLETNVLATARGGTDGGRLPGLVEKSGFDWHGRRDCLRLAVGEGRRVGSSRCAADLQSQAFTTFVATRCRQGQLSESAHPNLSSPVEKVVQVSRVASAPGLC